MKPIKERTSIILDEDVISKIREYAEEDDRSFSQYVNLILKNHIKERDNGTKKN